jgi:hypothetical protein
MCIKIIIIMRLYAHLFSSALKTEAVCSYETLVSTHKSTLLSTQKINIDVFTAEGALCLV